MEPRSSGRNKVSTGTSKGVSRRGSGLGTGPVGRTDGYSGRTGNSSSHNTINVGGRPQGGSSSFVKRGTSIGTGGLIVILIIIFLFNKFVGGSSGSDYSDQHGAAGYSNIYDSGSSSGGYSSGTTSSSSSSGWQNNDNNTAVLNTKVSSEARDRYTTLLGNGNDTVTIMLYMCGTDLESKSGMASNDISEIAAADIPDNLQIIMYTGGCKAWKTNGISSSVNQIYRIRSGKMECLVSDDGDKSMTDPATLTSFIRYCAKNYPANRQELIFWDHGGGSITGYGYDEKHSGAGSMDISEINQALNAAGEKFDFIGFDACLMATLETATMAANHADYLIASEETEPGVGWYYTDWVNALGRDTSMPTTKVGKNIIDGFVEECNRSCRGQKTTLSLIDLAELQMTVPDKLSAFSTSTAEMIREDDYKTVSNARAGSREFAQSSGIDQIDLVNFANSIGTDEAKALSKTLLSAVKYNRTSKQMTNAYGISIYFPYRRASKVQTVSAINSDIGLDDDYNKCIQAFAGLETTGQVSAGGQSSPVGSLLGQTLGGGTTSGSDAIAALLSAYLSGGRAVPGMDADDTGYMNDSGVYDVDSASSYVSENQFDPSAMVWTEDEDGRHVMDISAEQWDLIQDLQVNVFADDGSGFIDMGLDNIYQFTDDGLLIGDTDSLWFSIDNQPVAFYYESTVVSTDDETGEETVSVQGRVPVLLNGDRANLIIIFDDEHESGYIAGARFDYKNGETDAVAKGMSEIAEGTEIDFLCDYYSYDGRYLDSYMLGDRITYKDDLLLSYEDLGTDVQVTYLLTDIYNQEYWTPVVP